MVVCHGCKGVVWMVSWWKFLTWIGRRISWWTGADQEGYRCCLDMVVGVLTVFFRWWWALGVVIFGCGVCVVRRLWFGSIFIVASSCLVLGCFYVECFDYGRSSSWVFSFFDMFSILSHQSIAFQVCFLDSGGPIDFASRSGVSLWLLDFWIVTVSSQVDRRWGVPYWFGFGFWWADHFLFEIGS